MTKVRAISARVKFPNTPESDRMPVVWNIVTDSNGKEHNVLASDPLTAIDEFNKKQCASAHNQPGDNLMVPA